MCCFRCGSAAAPAPALWPLLDRANVEIDPSPSQTFFLAVRVWGMTGDDASCGDEAETADEASRRLRVLLVP